MDFSRANSQGEQLLRVFGDMRIQDTELDHMAQYYVNNAYPFLDMVDRALTWADNVRYHFDRVGGCHGQQRLF
jgi:hypothetical protein